MPIPMDHIDLYFDGGLVSHKNVLAMMTESLSFYAGSAPRACRREK